MRARSCQAKLMLTLRWSATGRSRAPVGRRLDGWRAAAVIEGGWVDRRPSPAHQWERSRIPCSRVPACPRFDARELLW